MSPRKPIIQDLTPAVSSGSTGKQQHHGSPEAETLGAAYGILIPVLWHDTDTDVLFSDVSDFGKEYRPLACVLIVFVIQGMLELCPQRPSALKAPGDKWVKEC